MLKIKILFVALLVVLTGLWLLADSWLPQPFTYFSFRTVFMQYSGVIAIAVMSIALWLALRPRYLDRVVTRHQARERGNGSERRQGKRHAF